MASEDAEEASTVRKLSDMSHELRDLYLGHHVDTVHVDDIDPLVFYREYVARNKPVLIRGAVDHWPALHKWNDAYLCKAMDAAPVTVNWTPDGLADAVKQVDGEALFVLPHEERMTYEAFLSQLVRTRADPALGVPYCSYQNDSLRAEFSAVAADVEESLSWADRAFGQPPEAVNFWAGDERSVTTYHQDPYENLYVVLRGEKIFTLLPPEDVWRMYVQERPCAKHVRREDGTYEVVRVESTHAVPWSHVDPYPDPSHVQDHCRLHPRYHVHGPRPAVVHVRAGELLYLPSQHFHHVQQVASAAHAASTTSHRSSSSSSSSSMDRITCVSHPFEPCRGDVDVDGGCCVAVNYWYDPRHDSRHVVPLRLLRPDTRTGT